MKKRTTDRWLRNALWGCVALLLWIDMGSRATAQEPAPKPNPAAAKDRPLRIVALGDSITKGVRGGVAKSETFSAYLQAELGKGGRAVEVTNVGIGGERTDGALARLDRDVIPLHPDVVLVMYGTNDSYVDQGQAESRISRDAYARNLRSLVERLRAAGAAPVLMTEPRWGDAAKPNGVGEHPNVRLASYMEACRDVAKELAVPLVDHFAIWTAKNATGFDIGKWTTDQCHPNPAGHQVLAANIAIELRRNSLVALTRSLDVRRLVADGKQNAFTERRQ